MNQVEDLTLEQLRDEVWFWRCDAAARLFFVAHTAAHASPRSKMGREVRRELSGLVETLSSALAGEYHPECFACAQPIRPGDAVIMDVTEGEMHAACPKNGEASTAKPGDKIFLEPEAIVIDEDHPEGGELADKPDHIVAHAASRLYDHEQIVCQLARAREALNGPNV